MFRHGRNKKKRVNFYSRYVKEQEEKEEREKIKVETAKPKTILKVEKVKKVVKFTPETKKEDLVIIDEDVKEEKTSEAREDKSIRSEATQESSGDEYPESEYKGLLIELGHSDSVRDFFATNKNRINKLPTEEVEMLLNQASKKL